MARNLTKAWLCELVGDSSAVLNAEIKDAGRAQIFRLVAEPNVSCEISDGEDFIAAAFTKKAVSAFEQRHDRTLPSANGALIQIKSCSLRCHLPHPPSTLSFCPNPDNGMCPKSLCASGHPQFWILISGFAYVGGDGNSVFGEPVNVNLRGAVSFELARLLDAAKATKVAPEPGSTKRVAATAVESLENVDSKQKKASKRQKPDKSKAVTEELPRAAASKSSRRSSGRAVLLPALGDVPFVDDMKSVWECQSMWSFLAIQQASVPFMPIHGMPDACPLSNRQQQQQTAPKEPEQQQPSSSAITHVSESTARSSTSQHLVSSEEDLNGLLLPAGHQATSASDIMNLMYGDAYGAHRESMDTEDSDEDEHEVTNSFNGATQHWDQPANFALMSWQLNS
ncbi:hypothetical protein IWW37_002536 [Coemansia sp. RSA 2050]|nr:hypothetical protein IWW37_002536 [Coemansia sp. RSA 2050]